MIDQALLAECHRLAFEIARELQSAPLYICDASQFAHLPLWRRSPLGMAISADYPDFTVKAAIGDEWQGFGNVIILNTHRIRDESRDASSFPAAIFNVFLHEIGHVVPSVKTADDSYFADFDCDLVREHQLRKQAEAETIPTPPPDDPTSVHNARFVRRVCHLWSRATLAGWRIPWDDIFGADLSFVSPFPVVLASLHRELFTLTDATFAEIESTEPPEEFSELWAACLDYSRLFQGQKDDRDS